MPVGVLGSYSFTGWLSEDRYPGRGNQLYFRELRIPYGSSRKVIEEVAQITQQELQAARDQGVNDIEILPYDRVIRFREKRV